MAHLSGGEVKWRYNQIVAGRIFAASLPVEPLTTVLEGDTSISAESTDQRQLAW